MNLKMKLMLSTLSVFALSNANAYDLSEFVKVKDGLYASLAKDGTLTEIAVTEQAKLALDLDESEESSQAIRNLLKIKKPVNKTYLDTDLCGVFDIYHDEIISTSGNDLSLIAIGTVEVGTGPFPPPPEFAYARSKAKLKGYDASGTAVLKSMAVDREGVNDSGNSINQSLLIAIYASSTASATIDTTGLSRVNWTAKTDYLVDNPTADENNGQLTQVTDCYQSFSVKVTNDIFF